MSVLSNSWRCSLVATALWTMLGTAPAPVAAGDQPASTQPAAADREKIQQQLRALSDKVQQLEKDGKHDEAEKVKHEARELYTKLRGVSTASQPAVAGPEADKIRAQLREIGQKVGELEKAGKHEDAERLKHEAMELYRKLNPHAGSESRSATRESGQHTFTYSQSSGAGSPEREQFRQQFQALHEKIEKAKQEGKADEVQRLMQEAQALRSKAYGQPGQDTRHPQAGGDRETRLQHLRAAAENLKAAGAEGEAQHVMQMIERMRAEGSGESRPHGESTRPWQAPGGSVPPGASTANPGQYGTSPAIQELRGQIEQMHREMREMREQLNKAKGGPQK